MAKSKKEVPKSVFSRAKKILTATTQLAAKEASLKIKKTIQKNIQGTELETRIEQAIILKNSLSELKGAAMKVGQLISLDVNEYLPKEVTDILSDLQAQSKSVDFSIIEKVLEEELQDKLLE
ncbi:MAG: hypothetical protein KDD50_12170, partial [Bdellovibrionales bacterium]|nr:hypothetical protein [Bdellovibrionales bacterium]